MTTYQLSGEGYVIKDGDTKIAITNDAEAPNTNVHYLAYMAWLAAGNVPAPAPAAPVQVPASVTRFQARAALHLGGHLETVEAMMVQPDTPVLARLAWQDALEFKRQSPTVLTMGAALGLTDADIDQLFIAAAQIEA